MESCNKLCSYYPRKDMFSWKVAGIYMYPCRHAMAFFRKWKDMSFPDILQEHVHDYYGSKSMQQIYGYNIFPVVKIRSGMMEKPIHQHWGCGNLDDPKVNESAIIVNFLILINPQLHALSVERGDIIKGCAQMLWHDPRLSYCR